MRSNNAAAICSRIPLVIGTVYYARRVLRVVTSAQLDAKAQVSWAASFLRHLGLESFKATAGGSGADSNVIEFVGESIVPVAYVPAFVVTSTKVGSMGTTTVQVVEIDTGAMRQQLFQIRDRIFPTLEVALQLGKTTGIPALALQQQGFFGGPENRTADVTAEGVVRSFYTTLLATMKDGRMLGQSGRIAKLRPAISTTFDVPFMTRLAIGPSWATLSSGEQQRVIEAFALYIAATYADHFDSYSGEQLQVTGERPYNEGVIIQTRIVKSNGEATILDYQMRQNHGLWQISDAYLDGTISQLAVHRAEFHQILQREGVDGLIAALDRKVDLLRNAARLH